MDYTKRRIELEREQQQDELMLRGQIDKINVDINTLQATRDRLLNDGNARLLERSGQIKLLAELEALENHRMVEMIAEDKPQNKSAKPEKNHAADSL